MSDQAWMELAIELAKAGEGAVEPNPMVGCVITLDGHRIGQGWHETFGGDHAEINALASIDPVLKDRLSQATAYVSLEPCSHHGKTGPCANALIEAGIGRVVVALEDPNPAVAGQGIKRLREAGIKVVTGVARALAEEVLAPYLKRTRTRRPWVIAKWAMTIDGKIATINGDSQWISNDESRERVHQLRSRVDAIVAGIGTVAADDPMLNARPNQASKQMQAPLRNAVRVIVDPSARISLNSKIVKTATQYPVLIAVTEEADNRKLKQLESAGCNCFTSPNRKQLISSLLDFLGDAGATNVMIEGGATLIGSMNDENLIDEIHAFVGPKLFGGSHAISPVAGRGFSSVAESGQFRLVSVDKLLDDVFMVYRRMN